MGINWHRLNRVLHRDIGYLAAGMTLLYAVSGILLNHIHDFNSNYRIERAAGTIDLPPVPATMDDSFVAQVLSRIGEAGAYRGTYQPAPGTLQIFLDERVLTVDLGTGAFEGEVARKRVLLWAMNALHLNQGGAVWMWFSDIYAAALAVLAVTGLFVLRGRQGITGRGAWLTATGAILPLLLAWFIFGRGR
jgi:hypothetical protein